jgi:hypothetical protein
LLKPSRIFLTSRVVLRKSDFSEPSIHVKAASITPIVRIRPPSAGSTPCRWRAVGQFNAGSVILIIWPDAMDDLEANDRAAFAPDKRQHP